MNTLTPIVAATDFSDEARHGIERAALIAKEQNAHLNLLHVISGSALNNLHKLFRAPAEAEEKLVDDARRMLNELAADISQRMSVAASASVKTGQVLNTILSSSEQAAMLVLGAHGLNPLRDLILGTTAERLLGQCTRPVLVTKRPPQAAYGRIVVPVDFSPYSAAALSMAIRIAPKAGITIIHAFRVPFEGRLSIAGVSDEAIRQYCEKERQAGVKKIRDLIPNSQDSAARISFAVERGDPSPVILTKAEELSADLIVIGKHGQSRVEELFLGSVTRHVLAGSLCDVLVVYI